MRFLLCLVLAFAGTAQAGVFNHRPSLRATERALSSEDPVKIAAEANRAVGAIVRAATRALRMHGHGDLARQLNAEWSGEWDGYLTRQVAMHELTGIGDHEPLSQWLADWYEVLELALGETLCAFLHLDDIKTFNYTVPVVFHFDSVDGDGIDMAEYKLHWVPFAGIVAYWSTWLACEIVTYGAGWFLVCTPAGMLAEYATVKWIAPPLTDEAWRFLWRPE